MHTGMNRRNTAMSVFVKPGPHTSKHYIPITLPYYIPMVLFPQVPFTIDFILIRNYQQKDFIKEAQFKSHIFAYSFSKSQPSGSENR